jgi:hypothetical protein
VTIGGNQLIVFDPERVQVRREPRVELSGPADGYSVDR